MEHRFIHQFSRLSRAVMTVVDEDDKLTFYIKWHGRMSAKYLKHYRKWKRICMESIFDMAPGEYIDIIGSDPIQQHLEYLWKKKS